MHVLHLIDGGSTQACATTLALLAAGLDDASPVRQQVMLLGGETLQNDALTAGLDAARRVPVINQSAIMGVLSLPRLMRRFGPIDLIHCWSLSSLTFAAVRFAAIPRLLTLTQPPSKRAGHWLCKLQRHAGARTVILPISHTIRRAVLTRGVQEDHVHVLRPGIVMGRIAGREQRASLREPWGVTDEGHKVIALPADPPGAIDAQVAARAAGPACETLADHITGMTLLVHPQMIHRQSAQRNLVRLGRRLRMVSEPRLAAPWSITAGLDAALTFGDHAGHLAMLWTMAGNVPIIAQATYAVSEILAHRHNALLAKSTATADLARRIEELFTDNHLAWQLRDTARHEAFSYFSPRVYRQGLVKVYEQIHAGEAIEIPPMEVTGGLRFGGTA